MATLADINKSLGRQETTLDRVEDNTHSTQKGINNFLKFLEKQKYKDLEAQREMGKVARPGGPGGAAGVGGGAGAGSGFKLPGMSGLGLAGIGGLAAAVGSGLIRRGLPSLLLYGFADEIVDHFFPDDAELSDAQKQMKDMLEGSIKGGALGFLLGKRFGVIGAVLGGLSQNELVQENFEKLKENLDKLGIDLNALGSFAQSFANTIGEGLGGFAKLLEGEFDFEALDEMLITMGTIALLLAPRTTIGLGMTLAGRIAGFNKKIKKNRGRFKGGKGPFGMLMTVAAALGLGYASYDSFEADGDPQELPESFGEYIDSVSNPGDLINAAFTASIGMDTGVGVARELEAQKFARRAQANRYNRANLPPGAVVSSKGNVMQAGKDGKATVIPFEDSQAAKSKYPRLASLLTIGKGALRGLGIFNAIYTAMSLAEVASILMNPDLTEEDKIALIGPKLGSALGAVGLGALGAVIGTAVGGPIGTLIGGGLGGVAGTFGGEYAGIQVAKFLLGKDVDIVPFTLAAKAGLGKSNVASVLGQEIGGSAFMAKMKTLEKMEQVVPAETFVESTPGQELAAMRAELAAKEMSATLEQQRPVSGVTDFVLGNDMSTMETQPIIVQDNSNNSSNGYNAYSMNQSGASTQDVVDAWVEGNRSSPR